jgi:cytochrome c oxidase subunit 4
VEHADAHPTVRTYLVVFAALLLLLVATVAVAEIDLGPFNFSLAVAIASMKALLILLYFMHVRYSTPLVWLVAGAGFFWLAILVGLTLSDYFTRDAIAALHDQRRPEPGTPVVVVSITLPAFSRLAKLDSGG